MAIKKMKYSVPLIICTAFIAFYLIGLFGCYYSLTAVVTHYDLSLYDILQKNLLFHGEKTYLFGTTPT